MNVYDYFYQRRAVARTVGIQCIQWIQLALRDSVCYFLWVFSAVYTYAGPAPVYTGTALCVNIQADTVSLAHIHIFFLYLRIFNVASFPCFLASLPPAPFPLSFIHRADSLNQSLNKTQNIHLLPPISLFHPFHLDHSQNGFLKTPEHRDHYLHPHSPHRNHPPYAN